MKYDLFRLEIVFRFTLTFWLIYIQPHSIIKSTLHLHYKSYCLQHTIYYRVTQQSSTRILTFYFLHSVHKFQSNPVVLYKNNEPRQTGGELMQEQDRVNFEKSILENKVLKELLYT